MRRYFNTEGLCDPQEHYMVKLDDRLADIKNLYVDRKKYFAINRGRQYGKTTTLYALAAYLKEEYTVLSLDFQGLGTEDFADAAVFVRAFAKLMIEAVGLFDEDSQSELAELANSEAGYNLNELFARLGRLCAKSQKPVVLMIDEVDSASNN